MQTVFIWKEIVQYCEISPEPCFVDMKILDFDIHCFSWFQHLWEMKCIILRIMSHPTMSEAWWLWRYKQNSACFEISIDGEKNTPIVLIMTVYYLTFNTVPCLELTGSRIAACNTGWTPIAPGYKTHHWGTLLSPSWWASYDASTASRLEMRHAKQLRPRYESADEIFDASTWNFLQVLFLQLKRGCSC